MLSLGTGATATGSITPQRQILPVRVIHQTTTLSPNTKIAGS